MKRITLICFYLIIGLAISQTCFAAKKPSVPTDPPIASDPCSTYAKEPPFLADNAMPSTTLLVDFSGSLNEHAYQGEAIKWDDGIKNSTAYTGFNATKAYYGYFDPYDYYSYNSGKFENATNPSTSTWSGNFLNWVSMHRIDIMRKAMTGGKYNDIEGTYTVSKTDGLQGRGKYHVYDDSSPVPDLNNPTINRHVTPSNMQGLLGFEQLNSTHELIVHRMVQTSSDPVTFKSSAILGTFSLNILSEKEMGVLDLIGPSTRLALFTFDDEGTADNGGRALQYMTDNASQVIEIINNRDVHAKSGWSPLAEALYTVAGYIQQNTNVNGGPRYKENYSYIVSNPTDPYYFATNETHGALIPCTQQNIVIISDGISTHDQNIPDTLKGSAYDKAINDSIILDDAGSGYLENVAYWAHTTDLRTGSKTIDGNQTANIYAISLFSSNSTLLKDAAKWGGFKDFNGNGVVDDNDWDNNGDGLPDNFFEVTSGSQLEQALSISMNALINRASSGGSASVVSTSRKGEGLLYQAVFWPSLIDGNGDSISWAGDVYAYWLDDQGLLYEDDGTNSSKRLAADDSRLTIWFDDSDPSNKRARACSGGSVIDGQCVNGTAKELTSVKHVWSASRWLNLLSTPATQRTTYNANENNRRFIKTWVDMDNDGKVDSGEYASFDANNNNLLNFVNSTTINWVRGLDQNNLRSRSAFVDSNYDNTPDLQVTWRLGDVINSSPTVVAAPAENYDLYWNDPSYSEFYSKYRHRRIMTYFGANDGMFHAMNSGFYSETDSKYYNAIHANGTMYDDNNALDLGAEMWAYVPYNLLPHLSCLTKENYQHQYFVDLKPRVFDAKVFSPGTEHPGGWGTILVSGFNFGGDGTQSRKEKIGSTDKFFGSSYFIFDVTNPENEPVFLGEMTFDGSLGFGFSINSPTLVATKDSSNVYWYLLFGNGPQELNGGTNLEPTGLVVPLTTLIQNNGPNSSFSFRPTGTTGGPTANNMGLIRFNQNLGADAKLACISTGFVSIDYDRDYFVDMMYYGLVTTIDKGNPPRQGGMHRLRLDKPVDPSQWQVKRMTETGQPITGAPNAAIKDLLGKTGSIWVYAGSGIFWDVAHKTSSGTQWMYGIEEKRRESSYDFALVSESKLYDVSNIEVSTDGLGTLECAPNTSCNIPSGVTTVEALANYISNTSNIDGWKRKLGPGERVLGQATVFGGLTNFVTFTPSSNPCSAEGSSKLYSLYYRTGTAWKENVFGTGSGDYVPYIVDLGQGMGLTPSLHLGSEKGVRAYIQTSTGSIVEIHQPNLPITGVKSGAGGWHTIEVD